LALAHFKPDIEGAPPVARARRLGHIHPRPKAPRGAPMAAAARTPAIFIGHGSPMRAVEDNPITREWSALAGRFERPRAIVVISAHWETKGVLITAAERQRTIHDFYNFPPAMYAMRYEPPGDPGLAKAIEAGLAPIGARADLDGWGLDHGAWTVLRHMYPDADVPAVQMSLDVRRTPAQHYEIGRVIAPLRDQGVLILGSGNIVHNLRLFDRGATAPAPGAKAFDDAVAERIVAGDHAALVDYRRLPEAALAVPENEHYLPLLYVLATKADGEPVSFFNRQVSSTMSMTSLAVGLDEAA
jgi:4,5-DOPA dioxygenase extradiol